MTASTYSEASSYPEDRDTDSLSSVSESRQSLDTFQIRARGLGSRASVHSTRPRGGPGGTFPRRNVVHIDDGRASVPRTMQRTRTPAEVAAANRRDFPRADSLGSGRDAPNILKDSQGNCKNCPDFGSAKHIKTLQSAMSTTFAGTAPYIAARSD
uniref:Uncharacterized protein n=1 Tax=Macrostomum lignano TaxID=282301 RepID=A0A1I8FP42_9PLAT